MSRDDFLAHMATGTTSVCRAWRVRRRDGAEFGFTDHDRDLAFNGIVFRAETGLGAQALQQGTGLSVDNSEAVGALHGEALTEADIEAGRFDGARVSGWLVNWRIPAERMLQFEGTIGEIRRGPHAFRAELRGLTEVLNRPQGLVYQKPCSAVLGDGRCRVDLGDPRFSTETVVSGAEQDRVLTLPLLSDFADGWFARGRVVVLAGAAAGLSGVVKVDRLRGEGRQIELWQSLQAGVSANDRVRLEAGCDKVPNTCKTKFDNFLNYRGFPTIPGDDWLMAYPSDRVPKDGGRR